MTLEERIEAFHKLGEYLRNLDETNKHSLLHEPGHYNPWFTPQQVNLALANVSAQLEYNKLHEWVSRYDLTNTKPAKVGVVMAGNIPMVGFHDLMCVLIAGHQLVAKPSSQDLFLIRYMADQLIRLEPRFAESITIQERLKDVDAVIATGSDNTARYFEYYFRNVPHVIRKNRSSLAILSGHESNEDLTALGQDVFSFHGLGCRNVSKIFLPVDYDIAALLPHWNSFETVINHHKYANNYDYNKSILLVNGTPFLDNGFLLITENEKDIVSPISVLYYERYSSYSSLTQRLEASAEKIQCIVGRPQPGLVTVPFGNAQFPAVDDYADGVDTLKFLSALR